MKEIYRLDTRDRPRLLFAMMQALARAGSRISFEGRLAQTGLAQLEGAMDHEDAFLKRATIQPRLDFLVLKLTPENFPAITKAITSKIPIGVRGIIHVQIVRAGEMAFAAYDGFDRKCVVAYQQVSTTLLDQLVEARVLRAYKSVALASG